MADQRYLVYKTEPNDHYTSVTRALEAAETLAIGNEGTTYYVRQAYVYDVSEVTTGPVTTITRERWDSLYAGWHFNEASGDRLDILGNYDLVEYSTVPSVIAKLGAYAADLDVAASNYLRAGTTAFRPSTIGSFTWTFWFKPMTWTTGNRDVWVVHDGGVWDWGTRNQGGVFQFGVRDGTTTTIHTANLPTMNIGEWYFITCLWDNANRQLRAVLNADVTNSYWQIALPNAASSTSSYLQSFNDAVTSGWECDEMLIFNELKSDPWIVDQYREGVGRQHPENL